MAFCWSPPGYGSAARPITTTYETTFHTFPVEIDQPQVGIVQLRQQADYDYQLGTLTTITDTNSNGTTAGYDAFGRLTSVVKPGDTVLSPTLAMEYHDKEIPFRYVLLQRETAGGPPARSSSSMTAWAG